MIIFQFATFNYQRVNGKHSKSDRKEQDGHLLVFVTLCHRPRPRGARRPGLCYVTLHWSHPFLFLNLHCKLSCSALQSGATGGRTASAAGLNLPACDPSFRRALTFFLFPSFEHLRIRDFSLSATPVRVATPTSCRS